MNTNTKKIVDMRDAQSSDLHHINELVCQSKSHWAYPQDFVKKFMDFFKMTEEYLQQYPVKLMVVDDRIVGVYSFKFMPDNKLELDFLFLHPDFIGQGYGRLLWQHLSNMAQALKYNEFTIWSDPEAEGFYLKMGCERIGARPSPLMPNRNPPMMKFQFKDASS